MYLLNIKMLALVHKKIFTTNKKQIIEYTSSVYKNKAKCFIVEKARFYLCSCYNTVPPALLNTHMRGRPGTAVLV